MTQRMIHILGPCEIECSRCHHIGIVDGLPKAVLCIQCGQAFTATVYEDLRWLNFRGEILSLADYRCQVCCFSGPAADGPLQVHHRYYVKGSAPWDYPYTACVVICKGCHRRITSRWLTVGRDEALDWIDIHEPRYESCDARRAKRSKSG